MSDNEVTRVDVPSQKQITNYAYYIRRKELPSGDAIHNIILAHENDALLRVDLFPSVRIVLSTNAQRNLLSASRDIVLAIDTTFDFVEGNLYLTTFLGLIEGIGVPLAFFLHSRRTESDYAFFLQSIKEKVDFHPVVVLRDFDLSIENAIRREMPSVRNFGDLWHFLHDNQKWLSQHGGKDLVKDAMCSLRILWSSPTRFEWAANFEGLSLY